MQVRINAEQAHYVRQFISKHEGEGILITRQGDGSIYITADTGASWEITTAGTVFPQDA